MTPTRVVVAQMLLACCIRPEASASTDKIAACDNPGGRTCPRWWRDVASQTTGNLAALVVAASIGGLIAAYLRAIDWVVVLRLLVVSSFTLLGAYLGTFQAVIFAFIIVPERLIDFLPGALSYPPTWREKLRLFFVIPTFIVVLVIIAGIFAGAGAGIASLIPGGSRP